MKLTPKGTLLAAAVLAANVPHGLCRRKCLGRQFGRSSSPSSRSSRASPATSSTSPCSAASRRRPRRRGATVNTQGPAKFDPTLQKPIVDSVVATKPDAILIAPTDVSAMQAPLEGSRGSRASRWSWSTPRWNDPSFAASADRLGQQGRRPGGLQGDQEAQPRRRQGPGHVDRPRHLDGRRPGQGLRGRAPRLTRPSSTSACSTATTTRPKRPSSSRLRWPRTRTSSASSQPTPSLQTARPPASARPASRTRSRSSASTPGPTRSNSSRTAPSRP